MTKTELKKLDVATLENDAKSLRKDLFTLRLGMMTGQVKDSSQFKKLRRQIARMKTIATEQRLKKQKTSKTEKSR